MDLLGVSEDLEEEEGKKKKKKPGTSKKALAKAAEEARQNLIKQKQEYLKELKIRVHKEWEANEAKLEFFEKELEERIKAFQNSVSKLKDIQDTYEEYLKEQRNQKEWAQYLKCNRLPDASSLSELNSFIYAWTELDKNCLIDECIKKTEKMMKLLKDLDEAISDPGPDCPPHIIEDLKKLRNELRDLLQEDIDKATFYLFSRIESEMVSINVSTSKYFIDCPYFLMNLWAELTIPLSSTWGKEVRRPRKVVFEEAEVTIIIPISLLDIFMVIRVMWLNYDHWSDKSPTYDCPSIPQYYSLNLYDLFLTEQDKKKEIMFQRENLERIMKAKIESFPPEPTLSQELMVWDTEPQRALSEEVIYRDFEEEDNLGPQVIEILNEFEVNLRERTFLGSFLLLEILHQPPQPKCLRFKHSVTLRQEPAILKPVDYYIKYPPPEEEPEETSDTEDGEIKIFYPPPPPPINLAEELKKLIAVQIKISDSVLWFEKPQLANWDPERNFWTREDIHDVIFDEEEGVKNLIILGVRLLLMTVSARSRVLFTLKNEKTIEFKTGRLGLIGLHVTRYCNLPYEDWLFEPGKEEGINFYLVTALLEMRFNIREGKVCLEMIKNAPGKVLNWMIGKYFSPAEFMMHFKKGGIDIFPAPDASSYVDYIQTKHIVIEKNVYEVWALFSKSFRFKMSKFNQAAGRKNIVFQAQEIYKDHQVDFCLIHTTMCSSYVLDIKENSEYYYSDPAPKMETCIDLYTLLHKYSTGNARRQSDATCYFLIQTVKEFLGYIRPLSFS